VGCRRERSGWRSETSPSLTARAGGGFSGPRTASGTGAKTSGGCRQIRRDAWFALHAATTTWAATASAWSAATGSIAREQFPRPSPRPYPATRARGLVAHLGLGYSVDQSRDQRDKAAPQGAGLAFDHLMAAESAVPVERTRDAAAPAALMQLQAAVGAARLLGVVQHHGRLVAARAQAWRDEGQWWELHSSISRLRPGSPWGGVGSGATPSLRPRRGWPPSRG